jgi:predicted permease
VRHVLSVTVLNVFLPALAFGLVVAARFDSTFLVIPLTGGMIILVGMAAGYAAYTVLPWFKNISRPVFGVMLFAAAFGNVTFLGLPVITEMFGAEQGYVAILYDQFASTPLLLTIGVLIASRYGSGKNVSLVSSIKRVLLLPPLWGALAGILVHLAGATVPRLVMDTAALMGKAVIPIMIFTVGLALDFQDVKRLALIVPALSLKLLFAPVLAWLIGSRLGLTGDTLKALTIEGAMPVMVISLVIADEFELDVPLTAMCIAASTVTLFFTMPVIMKLLF